MKIGISHILDSPGNSRSYFHRFPKGLSGPHCHTRSHRGILSHLTLAQETQILEGSPSAIYFLHNVLTVLNPLTSPPVNCTGQGVHIQIQMFSVEVRTAWSRQHADDPSVCWTRKVDCGRDDSQCRSHVAAFQVSRDKSEVWELSPSAAGAYRLFPPVRKKAVRVHGSPGPRKFPEQ